MDWITIEESCRLLEVSRPTLNVYRKKYALRIAKIRGKIHLSKTEMIEKIILHEPHRQELYSITLFSNFEIRKIQPFPGVYDLRLMKGIDAYGVMTLLCSIKSYLKENERHTVNLLLDGSPFCSYLESIGFFSEIMRGHADRVTLGNQSAVQKRPLSRYAVLLPLHLIGYRGAEKKILDELYTALLKQGFSEDYCGYIGWAIGELCDNAHTHSEGPCYLIIEGLQSESTQKRFLCIAVGDTGIGITNSLKTNPRYTEIEDDTLLPLAFKSEVSRMEVEPKRGKGLNDLIAISKGNGSWFKVESQNLALRFDFRNEENKIQKVSPPALIPGTRFCLVLIDGQFKKIERSDINTLIDGVLENKSLDGQ